MTQLIDIFSVLVLLGCLHIQLARNPKGAKSSPILLTRNPGRRAPRPAVHARNGKDECESARVGHPARPGIADCTSPYQNR